MNEEKKQEEFYKKFFSKQIEDTKKLPTQIKKDFFLYTQDSEFYNNHSNLLDEEERKELESVKKNMLKGFDLITPTKKDIVLYRGLENIDRISMNRLKSQFISTSTSRKIAEAFSDKECCVLVIKVLAGSRILPLLELSDIRSELEILIPPIGFWEAVERTFVNGKKVYLFTYKN